MEAGNDAFLDYLSRRLSHHEARLEKVSKYKGVEPSQLNTDQLNALADGEKSEGKREETEFLKEKYKGHLDLRREQIKALLSDAKKEGKAEAHAEFNESLQLLSSFLHYMSVQYKSQNPQIGNNNRESFAFYKLLEQFYLGGKSGAEAMERFIQGSQEPICENGVQYSELKNDCLHPPRKQSLDSEPRAMPGAQSPSFSLPSSQESAQEPEQTKPLPVKQNSAKQPSNSKSSNPSKPAGGKAVANGKPSDSATEKPQTSSHAGSEGISRQNSLDQFQIVGSNKSKDKGRSGARRKGNTKKRQPRQGKNGE